MHEDESTEQGNKESKGAQAQLQVHIPARAACAGVESEALYKREGARVRTKRDYKRLVDGNALDVEDELRVGGDAGYRLAAVCELGGDAETTLAAGLHAEDADVPALDDLADAELEAERLALLVRYEVVSFS
jgi:hypothetical protein